MDLKKKIQTGSIPKLIIGLSAPSILSLMFNALSMALDGMFVGTAIGATALSAVTTSLGIVLIIQAFSLLIASGSSVTISLRLGTGDKAGAERVIGNAITLSLILAAVMPVIGLVAIRPLLMLYGATGENIDFAVDFTSVLIGGMVFSISGQVLNNILKGMGYAKRAFINMACGLITNVVFDVVFIFVFKWGIAGAAASTIIGNIFCAVLALARLRSHSCMAHLRLSNMRLDRASAKAILCAGLPASIMQFSLSLVSLTFTHVSATWGGTTAVAAYGIMYNIMMIVYMPIMGLGQGVQPIIGFNYSAHNYNRVKKTLLISIACTTIFAVIMFVAIELFSGQIVGAFDSGNAALSGMAIPGLRLFSLLIPTVGFQMVVANYFQFIGKFKQSVILSALRQMILLIPIVLITPSFMGITGIWAATPLSDALAFIVTTVFFAREIKSIRKQTSARKLAAA